MKFLVVHPGADYSTADVFQGLVDGLADLGHDVVTYELGSRLGIAGKALGQAWREAGLDHGPTLAQVTYNAGHGVYATIIREQVQAVLVVTAQFWNPDHTIMIRRLGLPVGVILTECPYLDDQIATSAPVADAVWANELTSVPAIQEGAAILKAQGFWATEPQFVRYLRHAWNTRRHDGRAINPADADWPAHDVVFVGSGFQERIDLLEQADALGAFRGIDFGLYGDWAYLWPAWVPTPFLRIEAPAAIRTGRALAAIGQASPLFRYLQAGIVKNAITATLYRRATVGLNLSRSSATYSREPGRLQVAGAESLGPRPFELAATGTFFLSEWRSELSGVFGSIIPSFRSPGELAPLVREWVRPERAAEREGIAEQARLIVRDQTWKNRAAQIVDELGEAFDFRRAQVAAAKASVDRAPSERIR